VGVAPVLFAIIPLGGLNPKNHSRPKGRYDKRLQLHDNTTSTSQTVVLQVFVENSPEKNRNFKHI
jgi:hypothetical protein